MEYKLFKILKEKSSYSLLKITRIIYDTNIAENVYILERINNITPNIMKKWNYNNNVKTIWLLRENLEKDFDDYKNLRNKIRLIK